MSLENTEELISSEVTNPSFEEDKEDTNFEKKHFCWSIEDEEDKISNEEDDESQEDDQIDLLPKEKEDLHQNSDLLIAPSTTTSILRRKRNNQEIPNEFDLEEELWWTDKSKCTNKY